jgi:hypothetical protein
MTPSSETKSNPNYLLLIIVAGAVYWFATNKNATPDPSPDPRPEPTPNQLADSVMSILPTLKVEFRRIFEESAAKVESGEITSDSQLLEFVLPATKSAREQANKPFDTQLDLALPRNDDGTFLGKEKEAAALLRKIAKSW